MRGGRRPGRGRAARRGLGALGVVGRAKDLLKQALAPEAREVRAEQGAGHRLDLGLPQALVGELHGAHEPLAEDGRQALGASAQGDVGEQAVLLHAGRVGQAVASTSASVVLRGRGRRTDMGEDLRGPARVGHGESGAHNVSLCQIGRGGPPRIEFFAGRCRGPQGDAGGS